MGKKIDKTELNNYYGKGLYDKDSYRYKKQEAENSLMNQCLDNSKLSIRGILKHTKN